MMSKGGMNMHLYARLGCYIKGELSTLSCSKESNVVSCATTKEEFGYFHHSVLFETACLLFFNIFSLYVSLDKCITFLWRATVRSTPLVPLFNFCMIFSMMSKGGMNRHLYA